MLGRFILLMLLFVPALASYAGFAASFFRNLLAGPEPKVTLIQMALVFCAVVPALIALTYPLMLRYVYDRAGGSFGNFCAFFIPAVLMFGILTAAGIYAIIWGYATPGEVAAIYCVLAVAIMALAGRFALSRAPERRQE